MPGASFWRLGPGGGCGMGGWLLSGGEPPASWALRVSAEAPSAIAAIAALILLFILVFSRLFVFAFLRQQRAAARRRAVWQICLFHFDARQTVGGLEALVG